MNQVATDGDEVSSRGVVESIEGAPLGAVLLLAHRQLADELGELLAGSVVHTLTTLHAVDSAANRALTKLAHFRVRVK